MNKNAGMNYALKGIKINKVDENGEFLFAAIGLDLGTLGDENAIKTAELSTHAEGNAMKINT
ncbi:hypothetical protein [Bacillus sp. FSL K6-3431]|uniref:hypothetical protein n=1 Tax=Bacillus sp. FSL K6-3431 TaxID=2921500 RepID=UPI0030F74408